ncbi:MAG: phosphoesterase [Ktedonobacterales bacterium]|nr:phosphoesterase [Ktedonobacterales bacterium]
MQSLDDSEQPPPPMQTPKGISRRQLLRNALVGGTVGALGISAAGYYLYQQHLPPHASTTPTLVVRWNNAALHAIGTTHPGPPMVARALAVVHTCMYDAWTVYHPTAVPTQRTGIPKVTGQNERAKAEAISFAAYRALLDIFPTEAPYFTNLMTELGFNPQNTATQSTSPAGVGNSCAQAVITFRHTDGSNQLHGYQDTSGYPSAYGDYPAAPTPMNTPDVIKDPNHWQPLRIADGHGGSIVQKYIGPHWGMVQPFALTSGKQFRPASGPAVVTDPLYATQAQEILTFSGALTDEQKVIIEYWKDGPFSAQPPGHWCLIGQYVSHRDHHGLDADVMLFFSLANALLDASIACWDAKRFYDSVRPITAIRYLYADKSVLAFAGPCVPPRAIPGATWTPYQPMTFVTPAFPEYLSGHSSFSAAGAEILKRFTGSDAFGSSTTFKAGGSDVEPCCAPVKDVTLSWATFSEAADQAGTSRRYGGIHFRQGDYDGRALGRLVGAQAWEKAQAYLHGTV